MGASSAEELATQFSSRFYFGCEGDDPTTAFAFYGDALPFGHQLQAIFGSDISHWDVPDISRVLVEAYESVERGILSESQFKAFVFDNPIKLHLEMNPDFFSGTCIESALGPVHEDDAAQIDGGVATK